MTIAAEARSSADFVDLSSRYRADFPILEQRAPDGRPLIYLDHAATSQKPRQVLEALQQYYSCDNANVHRGAHYLSQRSTDAFEEARVTVAKFLNAKTEDEVIFTSNVTEAINKRERRPSDLSSNASNASSVHVSLTPCGPELVRVTLDISELLQEASPAPPS